MGVIQLWIRRRPFPAIKLAGELVVIPTVILAVILAVILTFPSLVWAQAVDEAIPPDPLQPSPEAQQEQAGMLLPTDGVQLYVSGNLKPLAIYERRDFGKLGPPPRENFEHLGVRTKLRLDGDLWGKAQLHTNHILDYNEIDQQKRTANENGNIATLRVVEAYVDVFSGNTRWRVGAIQKNYFYQFGGLSDPSFRFTPSDGAFQGYSLEDGRIPETSVEWQWEYIGEQKIRMTYIPVSGINKFSPTLGGFYGFLGYTDTAPENASTSNSKYMFEAEGTAGDLTYLLSYIDGLNPRPDFIATGFKLDVNRNIEQAENGSLVYNRYRTPGLDLIYTFTEEVRGKVDLVYYDTIDSNNEDPLVQNNWYQYQVGMELYLDAFRFDLNLGQKIVPDAMDTDDLDLTDAQGRRIYFQQALLNQPRERTDVLTFKAQGRMGEAGWLQLKFDLLSNWNESGANVRLRLRPEVAVYLSPDDDLLFRVRPDFDRNRELTTRRVLVEVEQRF